VQSWTATDDPTATAAAGDIVWDEATQQGYMRFTALSVNDPDEFQYQLWIFDAERDERYPIDGGVFDVPAGGGEIIVPISAKLPVSQAVLFAVTVEAPGGVVVSSRERIALLAEFG
jgi:anti-sigma-K factor RskA